MFLIHRDGTISNLRFNIPSGSYAFDVEARGAVESAAQAGAFGPLPRGFPDDVLPVIFSFDPRLLR
jgi:outer membrane biosynthesis protein TonB